MHTSRLLPLALLAILVTGCGSQPARPPVTAAATHTAEPTIKPEKAEPSPAPEAAEPAPVETAPVEVAPTPVPAAPETFTMPDLVGQNLQLAQDILQDLGSFVMDQEDASGLDRFQVNDSNWRVCSQNPTPAAVIEVSTVVTLASVKLAETCP